MRSNRVGTPPDTSPAAAGIESAPGRVQNPARRGSPAAPLVMQMITLLKSCPRCGGPMVRSRRRLFEYLLAFLVLRPYRCVDCSDRHYRPGLR